MDSTDQSTSHVSEDIKNHDNTNEVDQLEYEINQFHPFKNPDGRRNYSLKFLRQIGEVKLNVNFEPNEENHLLIAEYQLDLVKNYLLETGLKYSTGQFHPLLNREGKRRYSIRFLRDIGITKCGIRSDLEKFGAQYVVDPYKKTNRTGPVKLEYTPDQFHPTHNRYGKRSYSIQFLRDVGEIMKVALEEPIDDPNYMQTHAAFFTFDNVDDGGCGDDDDNNDIDADIDEYDSNDQVDTSDGRRMVSLLFSKPKSFELDAKKSDT